MNKTKEKIVFMFACVVCIIMLELITASIFYKPGSVRSETAKMLNDLIFLMIGFVTCWVMTKEKNDI